MSRLACRFFAAGSALIVGFALVGSRATVVAAEAAAAATMIVKVTLTKEIVRTFKDFQTFGNSMPVAIVLEP